MGGLIQIWTQDTVRFLTMYNIKMRIRVRLDFFFEIVDVDTEGHDKSCAI
jgi:hypothetical protein